MAILIDTSTATEGAVFQALVEISRCDPGLTGYQSDPGYVSVSCTQKNPGVASSNRLLEIAKSAETVVISGVDDTFQIGSRMSSTLADGPSLALRRTTAARYTSM
jgi:ABC-type cobalamin transport system permease subunit